MKKCHLILTLCLMLGLLNSADAIQIKGRLQHTERISTVCYREGMLYVLLEVEAYKNDWARFDPIVGSGPARCPEHHEYYILTINTKTHKATLGQPFQVNPKLHAQYLLWHSDNMTQKALVVEYCSGFKRLLSPDGQLLFEYTHLFADRSVFLDNSVYFLDIDGNLSLFDFRDQTTKKITNTKIEFSDFLEIQDVIRGTDCIEFCASNKKGSDETEVINILTGKVISTIPERFLRMVRVSGDNSAWMYQGSTNTTVHLTDKKMVTADLNRWLVAFDPADSFVATADLFRETLNYQFWNYKADTIVSGKIDLKINKKRGRFALSLK